MKHIHKRLLFERQENQNRSDNCFTEIIKMPLPNYGYANKEKKTHQDIVFEMAPEIVSDDEECQIINGKKVKRVRGKVNCNFIDFKILFSIQQNYQVTTGKIGIDLERILKINEETDPNVWKREVDPK